MPTSESRLGARNGGLTVIAVARLTPLKVSLTIEGLVFGRMGCSPRGGETMFAFDQDCAKRLLVALDGSNIGVAICDHNLRYRAINHTLARMKGLPPETHLGKTVHDILGPAARVIESAMSETLAKRKPITSVELEARLPKGNGVGQWIEDYFPLTNKTGEITGVCALVIEITRERQLERALQSLRGNALRKLILTPSRTHILLEQCRRGLVRTLKLKNDQANRLKALRQALDELQITLAESIAAISAAEEPEKKAEYIGDERMLSHREREIVQFLAAGKSNKEIGIVLDISTKTVETHRSRAMNKLHLASLAELVHYAIRHGIVEA